MHFPIIIIFSGIRLYHTSLGQSIFDCCLQPSELNMIVLGLVEHVMHTVCHTGHAMALTQRHWLRISKLSLTSIRTWITSCHAPGSIWIHTTISHHWIHHLLLLLLKLDIALSLSHVIRALKSPGFLVFVPLSFLVKNLVCHVVHDLLGGH